MKDQGRRGKSTPLTSQPEPVAAQASLQVLSERLVGERSAKQGVE